MWTAMSSSFGEAGHGFSLRVCLSTYHACNCLLIDSSTTRLIIRSFGWLIWVLGARMCRTPFSASVPLVKSSAACLEQAPVDSDGWKPHSVAGERTEDDGVSISVPEMALVVRQHGHVQLVEIG